MRHHGCPDCHCHERQVERWKERTKDPAKCWHVSVTWESAHSGRPNFTAVRPATGYWTCLECGEQPIDMSGDL